MTINSNTGLCTQNLCALLHPKWKKCIYNIVMNEWTNEWMNECSKATKVHMFTYVQRFSLVFQAREDLLTFDTTAGYSYVSSKCQTNKRENPLRLYRAKHLLGWCRISQWPTSYLYMKVFISTKDENCNCFKPLLTRVMTKVTTQMFPTTCSLYPCTITKVCTPFTIKLHPLATHFW